MTKKAHSEETARIIAVFEVLRKRIKLDLNLIIYPFSPSHLKKFPLSLFTCERSARKTEDKATFCIKYNPEKTISLSQNEIKRHAWHEIAHIIFMPLRDEHEAAVSHIYSSKLAKELRKREYETQENVAYLLERKLGPFLLPELNFDTEE